jgi:hypothetical protein
MYTNQEILRNKVLVESDLKVHYSPRNRSYKCDKQLLSLWEIMNVFEIDKLIALIGHMNLVDGATGIAEVFNLQQQPAHHLFNDVMGNIAYGQETQPTRLAA